MPDKTKSLTSSSCAFSDHQTKSGLRRKIHLGSFINQFIFFYTKKESNLSYTFLTDEALLEMNKEFLDHDTYTDIITFDLSDHLSSNILGDIYISVERVRENAASLGISYQDELLRVILHGALHLSGFGDKRKKEKEEMRSLENEWMEKYKSSLIS